MICQDARTVGVSESCVCTYHGSCSQKHQLKRRSLQIRAGRMQYWMELLGGINVSCFDGGAVSASRYGQCVTLASNILKCRGLRAGLSGL